MNGTTLERAGTSDLDLTNLQLDVRGPSGVKVQLASGIDISQLIPTNELLSFYSDNYVNYQTIGKIENQLKDRWTKILNSSGKLTHPPSLIRVFAVGMKKHWFLSYPLSTQQRFWSDWVDAQADLSLCWMHRPVCWFCHAAAHLSSLGYLVILFFTEILLYNATVRTLITDGALCVVWSGSPLFVNVPFMEPMTWI